MWKIQAGTAVIPNAEMAAITFTAFPAFVQSTLRTLEPELRIY
jgi:hypothetical protein